jgi:ubiquinone biosynthesis protein
MRDNHLSLPPDLTLLFKAMITLEGLGTSLIRISTWWIT